MNKTRQILQLAKHFLSNHRQLFGLPLVYLSLLLIVGLYLSELTNHNLLFIPTLFIAVGIFGYIRNEKDKSKY